jgi:hypothetical protein
MYDELVPFGKAKVKWLPADVMDLSRRQLEIFWRYYFLGDGSSERHATCNDQQVGATASVRLAGQLQEIVQKLGYCTSVRKYKTRATSLVKSEGVIYKARIRMTRCPSFAVDTLPYSGMTGSALTANGIVYVRRDGVPAWAG